VADDRLAAPEELAVDDRRPRECLLGLSRLRALERDASAADLRVRKFEEAAKGRL
jgi:hypothetical protein